MSGPPLSWVADLRASQELWVRAPSAHNTQPWRLRVVDAVDGDSDEIELGWEADRTLPVTDATSRDLQLTMGALAEAMSLVLRDQAHGGHRVEPVWSWDESRRVAGRLRLVRSASADEPGLTVRPTAAEVATRRTHRGDYLSAPTPAEAIFALSPALGGHPLVGLTAVDEDLARQLVQRADRAQFEDGPGAAELARWLRWRPEPPDGLGHEALLLPSWQVAALARMLGPTAHPWLRRAGVLRLLARSASTSRPGTVLLLHAPADLTPEGICDLGRSLLRGWLEAGRHGWSVHPWSQLLDVPETAAHLADLVPAGTTPYSAFRVGVARGPAPPSPRRHDIWGDSRSASPTVEP